MGADMLLYVIPDIEMYAERKPDIIKHVNLMDDREFDDWAGDRDDLLSAIDDYESYDIRRDVCQLEFANIRYFMTGGMSYGDDPTDSACSMAYLEQYLFDLFKHYACADARMRMKNPDVEDDLI